MRIWLVLLLVALVGGLPVLAQQDGGMIAYGDIVSGEITDATPEIGYTFSGSAGDVILAEMTALNDQLDSYLQLLAPDGAVLAADDDGGRFLNARLGPLELPTDGDYTLVATRCCPGGGFTEGPFELSFDLTDLPVEATPEPQEPGDNALSYGEPVTGEITAETPEVTYTFAGSADDVVTMTMRELSGGLDTYLILRDPAGNQLTVDDDGLGNLNSRIGPYALPQDGTYTVVATACCPPEPRSTGTFELVVELTDLAPTDSAPISIDYGEVVTGTLIEPSNEQLYTFSGAAGDLITIEMSAIDPNLDTYLILRDPGGTQIATDDDGGSGFNSVLGPFTLPQGGTYTIVATSCCPPDPRSSGTFELVVGLTTVAQTAAGTLGYDEVIIDEIPSPGAEVRYDFSGAAGDTILIEMTALEPSLDSYLILLGPDGTELSRDDDSAGDLNSLLGPFTLPEDGTYTVVATSCCPPEGRSAGQFELVINMEDLPILDVGQTVTLTLTPDDRSAYYLLPSVGDEILAVNGTVDGTDVPVAVDVRGQEGQYFTGGYSEQGTPLVVEPIILPPDANAIMTVSIQPFTPGMDAFAPVTITLTLRASTPQPLELGQTVSATIDEANLSVLYTFSGSPSELYRLSGSTQPADAPLEIQVLSPEGFGIDYVDTGFTDSGAFVRDPLRLRETGMHFVLVRRAPSFSGEPVSTDPVGFSLTVAASDIPTVQPNAPITSTFDPNMNNLFYRYEGTAGETIRVELDSASPNFAPGVSLEYSGEVDFDMNPFIFSLQSGYPGAFSFTTTLPYDGVYLIIVNNGVFAEDGRFALEIDVIE